MNLSSKKIVLLTAFMLMAFSFLHAQSTAEGSLQKADSFFMDKDYKKAKMIYTKLLTDTSTDALHLNRLGFAEYSTGNYINAEKDYKRALSSGPVSTVKASILSRLARISALKKNDKEAIDYIDSAVSNGYVYLKELDTLKDFNSIRGNTKFRDVRGRLFNSLYPCMNNLHAREFDFWIGEWDVYVTGTNMYAGHSLIQKVSGGCAILENWSSAVSDGKSLNFVDDSTNKWKQVWVGSYPNGKQDFINGEYKDSAMRFSFETNDAQGNKITGRFTFFNQGPAQVRQLNETSVDGGKSWTVSYDFTYKRKK